MGDMTHPKLNPIEAFPVEHEGQELICLRDPYSISDKVLYVSPETLYILGMFDGEHSVSDIRDEILSKFGQSIETGDIERLIDQMDEALFLASDRFTKFKNDLESSFLDSQQRAPNHAGLSYPDDPGELQGWISEFMDKAEQSKAYEPSSGKIRGIISPHIDFTRGGESYAKAYRELEPESNAETYIIFGTSHYAEVDNPFILTKKDFDTPFGRAETDREIVDRLSESCPWDLFYGEISHRTEHSIEFQVAFLQYFLRGGGKFKILPVLCNSFYKLVDLGKSPSEDERVQKFLESIGEIVSELGDRVFVIAGADMAHVGPKFGDSEPVSDSTLSLIRERDLISLEHCVNLDPEGFYHSVEKEKDWRKICGLSPIYALLRTLEVNRGELLDYDQALEPDTGSVVSFASAAFYS